LAIKGIVHPKMEIYSSSCCFKPVWIYFFCWTQNIFKNVGNQTVDGPHCFSEKWQVPKV